MPELTGQKRLDHALCCLIHQAGGACTSTPPLLMHAEWLPSRSAACVRLVACCSCTLNHQPTLFPSTLLHYDMPVCRASHMAALHLARMYSMHYTCIAYTCSVDATFAASRLAALTAVEYSELSFAICIEQYIGCRLLTLQCTIHRTDVPSSNSWVCPHASWWLC